MQIQTKIREINLQKKVLKFVLINNYKFSLGSFFQKVK